MWFLFALITTAAWGAADLFYKKGASPSDRYSHLKTAALVGLVMGAHAIFTLLTGDLGYRPVNLIIYLPVSLMYILSMAVGYFGLRYLELSISSPVQNSSGALTCILCVVVLGERLDGLTTAGVALVCAGVVALGVFERVACGRLSPEDKKYSIGFVAFLMPVIYCILDALGTFLDAYYLDDWATTPLRGVTEETFENIANVSYELTFLAAAVVIILFLLIRGERLTPRGQGSRALAAVLETAGQATYVFAMSGNGAVAAPMIASYSIVSLILSRIFLKERLTRWQYASIAVAIAGIALLGLADA